jgi:hypothetical protein
MRVARISTRLACGLGGILLIGASGIAAVGILLGESGGWPAPPTPSHGLTRGQEARPSGVARIPAPGDRAPIAERGPGEVLLSLK